MSADRRPTSRAQRDADVAPEPEPERRGLLSKLGGRLAQRIWPRPAAAPLRSRIGALLRRWRGDRIGGGGAGRRH